MIMHLAVDIVSANAVMDLDNETLSQKYSI